MNNNNYELTERELDEVMALFQDHALWNSQRILPAIPYLINEIRRHRGTSSPTSERDRRNTYPRNNNRNHNQRSR